MVGVSIGACQLVDGLSGLHDPGTGGASATATASSGTGGSVGMSSTTTSSTTTTVGTGGSDDAGHPAAPGTVLWARSLSALGPTGVAQGSSGLVVAGYFGAPISLGGPTLHPAGQQSTAYAGYTASDATWQYQNSFGGAGQVTGFMNELGSGDGHALLHGVAYGATYDLGQGPVDGGSPVDAGAGTYSDGFVGDYGENGPTWVRRLVGPGNDGFVAAVNGPSNTVFAAGWFEQTSVLDQGSSAPLTFTATGGRTVLLAQFYLFGGAPVMTQTYGGPSPNRVWSTGMVWTGSKVATGGQVVMTGTFNNGATFGTLPSLPPAGADDVWVAAFKPDGTPVWSVGFGGPGYDEGGQIVADAAGDLYLCGSFSGNVSFGSKTLMSSGGRDVFLAKLDGKNGSVVWADSFGSSGDDGCSGLALDPYGRILVASKVSGPIETGGASFGGFDAAFVAYESTGARRWAQVLGTSGDESGSAVTAPEGPVFAVMSVGGEIGQSVGGAPIVGPAMPGGLLLKMQP